MNSRFSSIDSILHGLPQLNGIVYDIQYDPTNSIVQFFMIRYYDQAVAFSISKLSTQVDG